MKRCHTEQIKNKDDIMKYILTTLNDIFTAVVCLFGNGLTLYVFHYFYYGYEFCKDMTVAIGLMERKYAHKGVELGTWYTICTRTATENAIFCC